MTKIKNTKKGMAKKTLSISLAVAMLATSNVPVWAAEFTDGTDAAFTSEAVVEDVAEVVEEAPVVEEEVTESAKSTATNNENITVDVKVTEDGWGYYADIDAEHTTINGLGTDTKVKYYWTVDGNQVTETKEITTSDGVLSGVEKYVPKKQECGHKLAMVIFRDYDAAGVVNVNKDFTWTSDSVTISRRDINNALSNINLTETATGTVKYDGTEHKDASEWVSEITFGDENTDGKVLKFTDGDFNVVVNGTKGLVNADTDISISVKPVDTTYYTGEYVKDVTNNIATRDYKEGDLKVEYIGKEHTYNNHAVELKSEDFKVTDTLSGEVLDSKKVIYAIKDNNKINAGKYNIRIDLKDSACTNYTSASLSSVVLTVEDWEIKKLNLADCTITLGSIKFNEEGDPVTAEDLVAGPVAIKDAKGTVVLSEDDKQTLKRLGLNLTNVQANDGSAGIYTATVKADSKTENYTGETAKATFRIYNNLLDGAFFKGEGSTTNPAVYAEEPEYYTGEAITKDISKLGHLMLNGKDLTVDGVNYDTNFEYNHNTNAGKASFTVKGINSFKGSDITFYFDILAASVDDKDVKAAEKVTFDDTITDAKDYDPALTVVAKNGATPAKEFTLVKGTDYTVEYSFARKSGDNYTEVSTDGNKLGNYVHSKITIVNDNFKGGTVVFDKYTKITKPQVSNWTVSTEKPSYTYTGEAIIPELIVKDGSKELEYGVDYEIKAGATATNVGTATIILVGKGDYDETSTISTTFEITPANTSDLVVNVNDMEYTGQRIRPTANDITSVKLGKVAIDLSQFTISYPDSKEANKQIGTGTFTLTPKVTNKNFVGTKEVKFNIVGKKINAVDTELKVYNADGTVANLAKAFLYDGTEKTYAKAEFSYVYTDPVTHKTVTLEEGKDFEIKYFHNVYGKKTDDNATSGTAYIAVVGKGNFAGADKNKEFTDENGQTVRPIAVRTFTINSVSLTDQNVKISNGAYAEGLAVKPVITVTYGKDPLTLELDKDYEFSGVGAYTEPTTSNKYTVSVKGINGYTGEVDNLKWGIDKKNLADCEINAYNDEEGLHVVVMNGSVRVPTSKYVVTENADRTVTVTPVKDSKYYTGSKTVKIAGEDPDAIPETPVIVDVKVSGNNATAVLSGACDGATGYDYVISKDRNCIVNKDYAKVNRNKLTTDTTFTYTQQGTYYAYCHAWKRGADGKKIFSEWSNPFRFEVSALTPAKPVIKSVKVKGSTVTVTYDRAADADGYDVVLGSKLAIVSGEKRPVEYGTLVKKNQKTTTVTFKNVKKGTYYVGLHAFNRTSEDGKKVFSPWSNAKKIVVK